MIKRLLCETAIRIRVIGLYITFVFVLASCSIQKNLLFQSPTSINPEAFEKTMMAAQSNYLIQKGDYIAISVFPNNGEQIIDQTGDFLTGTPQGSPSRSQGGTNQQQLTTNDNGNSLLNLPLIQNNSLPNSYLVEEDGAITLPRIGRLVVDSLTLRQATKLITARYEKYVVNPFVVMQYLNKRVFLMGALGDRVIALRNENMSLYEVLALAGGANSTNPTNSFSIQRDAKTRSIRIVRNYQTDPSVLIIDLTTIEGVSKLNTNIQPNDIIYVEPRRKIDREGLNDVSAILSPITSIVALIVAITAVSR